MIAAIVVITILLIGVAFLYVLYFVWTRMLDAGVEEIVLEVRVTRAFLRSAYYESTTMCPIAMAIREHMNASIYVYSDQAWIGHQKYLIRAMDNRKARWRNRTWWGLLMGGFKIQLIHVEPPSMKRAL